MMMNEDEDEASKSCIFRVFPRICSLPIPLPFRPGVPEVDLIDVEKALCKYKFRLCLLLYSVVCIHCCVCKERRV